MESNKPETPLDQETAQGEMSEAEIDQNLADTFPASDPPSWTLGTNHVEKSDKKPSEVEESERLINSGMESHDKTTPR